MRLDCMVTRIVSMMLRSEMVNEGGDRNIFKFFR